MNWAEHAACAGTDPEVFFPRPGRHCYEEARRICNRCPVRRACLESILLVESGGKHWRHGMFGGTTPHERASMHWLWELTVAA